MRFISVICIGVLVAAATASSAEDRAYPDVGSIAKTPPASKEPALATQRPPAAAPNLTGSPVAATGPSAGALSPHPFSRDASGTFTRTLFSGPGPKNITVTVRDIEVGPSRIQEIPALPGPAVVEWLEGHGTFSVAGGPAQAIGGEFKVIPSSQPITINNLGRQAVGFRLYIFVGE